METNMTGPEPKMEAVTPVQEVQQGEGAGAAAGGAEARSHSKSSSTSSSPPSRKQMARTLRHMREDVESHDEALGELRKQVLWTMSQQVRTERLTTSRQLVLQGFAPALEDRNVETAMLQRDQWIASILKEYTRLPERRLTFTASHATAIETLSRLTIITLAETSVAALAARALAGKRVNYAGASITIKRQQAAYDRIISAPAKCCMDILTKYNQQYQGKLKPNWKEGTVYAMDAATPTLLLRWVVNPERAKVKIFVLPQHVPLIEQHIDEEIRRLQFGSALHDQKGKGKGADFKGGAKGKGKKTGKLPVDESAFKQEPMEARQGLANMTFSRYPFNISIRNLDSQDAQSIPQAMPVDQEGAPASKRLAEAHAAAQDVKRRSPSRETRHYRPAEGWPTDPWASAAAATSRHSSSSASRPPRPEVTTNGSAPGRDADAGAPSGAGDAADRSARVEA